MTDKHGDKAQISGGNKYRVTDLIYGGGKFVAAVQDSH